MKTNGTLKTVFIAGVSGSIGQNALSVLETLARSSSKATHVSNTSNIPNAVSQETDQHSSSNLNLTNNDQAAKDRYRHYPQYAIAGFSMGQRTKETIAWLRRIAKENPALLSLKAVAVRDPQARRELSDFLHSVPEWRAVRVYAETDEAFTESTADVLINALSGGAGLIPTFAALQGDKRVLLANKESLVMGGRLIQHLIREKGARMEDYVLPIDSEHKALQTLSHGWRDREVRALTLTASGGPFWDNPIADPTPAEALKHPNWDMGAKISIDSATMMNKGLEIIEAHILFDIPYTRIQAIIHKEQVIHGLIELINGEMMALLGASDMRYSIQGALTYPDLAPTEYVPFRLGEQETLSFHAVPPGRYPLFDLACACGKMGGPFPIVLNAINEVCVHAFLSKQLRYTEMMRIICETVERYEKAHRAEAFDECSIDAIVALDQNVRDAFYVKYPPTL